MIAGGGEAMGDESRGDIGGRVAVVTGAGRGIGRVISARLADAGATVCLIARTAHEVKEAANAINRAGGSATAMALDVTNRTDVEGAFSRIESEVGPVSVLVNNAGTLDSIGPMWEADPDVWWRDMEVHVRGTLLCTHAALGAMVPRRSGRIVNVVGMLGQQGEPHATAYASAKAAMFRLTDCLSTELRAHGVGVFCMSPGPVRTEMTVRLAETDTGRRWFPAFAALTEDEWVPPDRGAELVLRIARGDADALRGRYIHVNYDLDELIAQADEINSSDRLKLRVIS